MKKNLLPETGKGFLSGILNILIALTIVGSATVTCMGLMFNYVNSKSITIEIGCLTFIALGLLTISWRQIKAVVAGSRIVQAVLAFLLVYSVAALVGKDPALSFYGHFERGTGVFFMLITVFGTLLALISAHANGMVRRAVLYPLAVTGAALGFLTWLGSSGFATHIWVVLGPSAGGGATMGNSSYAGTILIMTFFVTLYLFVTSRRAPARFLLGVVGFFTIINPVLITLPYFKPLSGTAFGFIGDARGATLSMITGLAMALAVSWTYSARKGLRAAGRVVAWTMVGGIVIALVLLVIPGNKIHDGFIKESGAARFIYWNMAVQQTEHHWVIGTGPETFRYAHQEYFNSELFTLGEPWADKPHNAYLETALTTGLLGFALYLSIFGFMIWKLLKMKDSKHRALTATAIGLITAYMLNNFILFDTMTSYFMFFIVAFWIASESEWHSLGLRQIGTDAVGASEVVVKAVIAILILVSAGIVINGEIVKLNLGWQELFSVAPQRTELYARTEAASPYGAGISYAQRADDYAQRYATDMTTDPNLALADINAITSQLITSMEKYPPNMQSYDALAKLSFDEIRYLGGPTPELVNQIRIAGEGINNVSQSRNPLGDYYLSRADAYAKQ